MNVLYIFDDNYADISGVSIYSLLKHNESHKKYNVYCIDGGISEKNKDKLTALVESFHANITFIPFINPEEVFGLKLDIAQWCETNYLRIILERVLPRDVKKILYIDSDTLIRKDLSKLYEIDLHDHPIAAAYDCYPLPKYQLGLGIEDDYYSDGILILDLELLRSGTQFEDYSDLLKERKGKIAYLEQGAINYVMRGNITLFGPEYNLMTLTLVYRKCPDIFFSSEEKFYTKKELSKAISDPAIVHLTGNILMIRPWCKYSNHPYAKEWRKVLSCTPWASDFQFRPIKYKPAIIYSAVIRVILLLMNNKAISTLIAKKSKRMRNIEQMRREIVSK